MKAARVRLLSAAHAVVVVVFSFFATGAPAAALAQDAPSAPGDKAGRAVRIHLSDGTLIVGTLEDESGPALRVRTRFAGEIAVPRASVLAIEDENAPRAARPVSVVRFVIDSKGGARKTEPRLLRVRGREARSEFRFLVTGRIEGVARADGTELPFRTEARPNATLVSVELPSPLGPGESEWIAVRTYDAGSCSRVSAAEALFRYRRGAPVDEVAVVQVVLPEGGRCLSSKPESTEIPAGTLLFKKDLAQGETFDVEVTFSTTGH